MGFFGRLFKGIGNVIKKIAKKLGIIDEEIGSSKSTNENSQVNDIAYMSKTLDSYSQTYKKLAENLEDNCINFVDGYFDQLLTDLSGLTELYQSIDVSHLRKTQNNIRGQIRGAYINPIKIRLSLDDNECRKIIKLAPGDSKTQKIKEFSNRVFLEANKNLIESVQKVLQEQIEEINTRVAEYVNNKENRLQTMHLQYENLEKEFKNGTFDKEKTQVVPKIKIDILNRVLKEIEG